MSTIVMRVDLDCDKCYKKIRKVLCKLQDRENIKAIAYDEKNNTVMVSGSFDAEEVSDRLCSSAGKVITDIQVARANQMMPGPGKAAPKHPGKENHGHKDGHGHAGGHGGGQKESHGPGGGGHGQKEGHGHGGGHVQKEGYGHGGGGGGKPDKTKHVMFDMGDEDFEEHAHHGKGHGNDHGKGHGQGHGNGHGEKPKVFTTTAMSRNEAPRLQQPASMSAMAPMRMPQTGPSMTMMPTQGPSMTMMPQAMATPSIWPAPGPAYGYSAPAYGYGGGPPAGGYYGGPVYDHGGYGAYGGGGYGRNPYQPQYYKEEPSAGCSVM